MKNESISYCDCKTGYEEYYDGCFKEDEIKNKCKDTNCKQCIGSSERFLECAEGYGLSDGKCDEGYAPGECFFPCLSESFSF